MKPSDRAEWRGPNNSQKHNSIGGRGSMIGSIDLCRAHESFGNRCKARADPRKERDRKRPKKGLKKV